MDRVLGGARDRQPAPGHAHGPGRQDPGGAARPRRPRGRGAADHGVRTVEPEQALAYRLVGHHLHRRTDALTAIGACGIQDSPPGWAAVALHARSHEDRPTGRSVVQVNAMRNAPHLVPRADVAVFTLAAIPPDDELAAVVGRLVATELADAGYGIREALDRVGDAARDALADGPLGRDELHQAFRERLPDALLAWCPGCESHHLRSGLWRTLGRLGITEMPAKATWSLLDPPVTADPVQARAELARRFLRCFGPATHGELATWTQTSTRHARRLIADLGDAVEQVLLAGRKRWVLADETAVLDDPPTARGVRLLGGFDPYVAQPDRATLVPDRALARRMFPSVGRPGVLLHDGRLVGLWRARKAGSVLQVRLEALDGADLPDVQEEADAVARLRGCDEAQLRPA
ncbi:hypothetical protein C7Y72_14045 [Paraconexibacter algicola]|uniref:Winged helix DNA-binding domain-containing protein n=1 Tax=Paraconexibacter algicola TaxID=2133960 RepID=A0A2T4UFS9_9ACTN|nr:hypothetical protein C7Y72_14045 [Paraconexibacter algicola]